MNKNMSPISTLSSTRCETVEEAINVLIEYFSEMQRIAMTDPQWIEERDFSKDAFHKQAVEIGLYPIYAHELLDYVEANTVTTLTAIKLLIESGVLWIDDEHKLNYA